ncbi:PA0069 family radical SAM protein [Octadecabacter sp. 1_MG-2023]|uniref:PA0069 family radical SAM protein n=1 Tax=unclassified Octadecabacter TaxID=196158 RepID=UPI001C0983D7|nr:MULTISPECIES: PA0069 family radical SAM protein [unclassified Octadecabacter]MBU2993559.1 PA0069 family radical SAM protein [Octadecabacter sp. B2R22]MDO6735597.1 PA0069 family radical SAM protein [Octadecabacter sp. 1_MG-2023]
MRETQDLQRGQARGRGAISNTVGRFEPYARIAVDDGWDAPEEGTLRTEVAVEVPRKVITRNASPDVPFDRSINPYRGCEHGCVYCFARPGHAWLGMSPGQDFESRLIARPTAPQVLEDELRKKSYRPDVLAIGTYTDPYQPIEKTHGIMRGILEVLRDFHHPVSIVTKGSLIERDIDILKEMAGDGLARVGVSVTTLDPQISRAMEPRVPSPKRRLLMIERLAAAGIPVTVSAAPMVPALTDHELESILEAGKEAGATSATAIMLRLPLEVAPLFEEWAQVHFPDRANRIMNRVRELHGGKLYEADFGTRMTGQGIWAQQMKQRLTIARSRYGLDGVRMPLRRDLFSVPPRKGDQMSLF